MTEEIWKAVPGFANYEVSNLGQVRNIKTSRILKPIVSYSNSKDYLKVTLYPGQVKEYIHRLVLLAFIGPPPDGQGFGCHLHDDSFDNRLSELAWGSREENERMKYNYKQAHAVPLLERGDAWDPGGGDCSFQMTSRRV